ncbi:MULTISPECIES: acyltransferase [unclassified Rhizobium]|uniref:acyltransferase n=1 Tax=unclassified Rhizobium TaxID=2613769 RepID=UPI000BE9CE23|nr:MULTISPECIES: acyltransferase [unclassified Rhizobium]MDF0657911.1 acyltransferase [Rhizobium sp. BC49]PDS83861.1 transferase [Rhizobium sp. L18]
MAADKASYRNRGGILQRLVTAYKRFRYFSRAGANLVVKRSAEFRMVKHAVLEVGSNVTIQDYSFFQLTMPEPKVFIGNNTVIGRRNIITAKNRISIGNDVLIGSDVQIIDHGHGMRRDVPIRLQKAEIGFVEIGDDVWIGAGAKILMNVTIGTGAVIGTNSVVTADIPEYAIAVGSPAKVVKYRI